MTNESKQLLSILKSCLFRSQYQLPEKLDWSDIYQEATSHTVVGLLIPYVKRFSDEHSIPNIEQWFKTGDQLLAYFVNCFQAQIELVNLFEESSIPILIVKGYAAAVNYPNPQLRTIGDIDFLIPKNRFEEGITLLEKYGYVKRYGDCYKSRHIVFTKNYIVLEMHRSMSSFGLDIDSIIDLGFEQFDYGMIAGISFPMLPPLENGLVLLTHIRQHLLEEDYSLGLRQIIDWAMYVNRYCGTIVEGNLWDQEFMAIACQLGLDTLTITLTYICREWLGLQNFPDWCERADHKTATELVELVMACGNFGSKLEHGNKSIKQGFILYRHDGIFKRLQMQGLNNWKAAQKHVFLRHFAWLFQLFRNIILIFSSKNIIYQLNAGKKKSELISRLRI